MKAWDNSIEVACPKCGEGNSVDVIAEVWTRITCDGSDNTQAQDGCEEFNGDSPAACRSCGHSGTWREFHSTIETNSPPPAQSPSPNAMEALRAVKAWHTRAPIAELETVEASIGENFPQALVDAALASPPPVQSPDAMALLRELVDWQAYMGGFDSPVWDRAKALLASADNSPKNEAAIMDEVCTDLDRIARKIDASGAKDGGIQEFREMLGATIDEAQMCLACLDVEG